MKKEKEDDVKQMYERQRIEMRKDLERKKYYEQINVNGNTLITPEAQGIIDRLKKEQQQEDERIQYYYDAKNKEANLRAEKEKIRRQQERADLKKYLDMQIEEKKKEEAFLKSLDDEQARIWNIDCDKYYKDEKIVEQKIKAMNKRNLELIMDQMKQKQRSKSQAKRMTNEEYKMNKEILERAKAEEGAK